MAAQTGSSTPGATGHEPHQAYYVPAQSKWPIIGAVGLFLTVYGAGTIMMRSTAGDETTAGWWVFLIGSLVMAYMLFGWFSNVIRESMAGLYSDQMDRSFRWGMSWFIFSEVMFFAAFFFALFYARYFAVPWLGGEGERGASNMLWSQFQSQWPLMANPNNELFPGPTGVIDPWHIPLLNTILLLTSSVTVTIAHKALKQGKRQAVKLWLAATILLGAVFLSFQIYEYVEAYNELNLTLKSGIYGSTFVVLTGFPGAHVTIWTITLLEIWLRMLRGYFCAHPHFGSVSPRWYWYFVVVVRLGLFGFVYLRYRTETFLADRN